MKNINQEQSPISEEIRAMRRACDHNKTFQERWHGEWKTMDDAKFLRWLPTVLRDDKELQSEWTFQWIEEARNEPMK